MACDMAQTWASRRFAGLRGDSGINIGFAASRDQRDNADAGMVNANAAIGWRPLVACRAFTASVP